MARTGSPGSIKATGAHRGEGWLDAAKDFVVDKVVDVAAGTGWLGQDAKAYDALRDDHPEAEKFLDAVKDNPEFKEVLSSLAPDGNEDLSQAERLQQLHQRADAYDGNFFEDLNAVFLDKNGEPSEQAMAFIKNVQSFEGGKEALQNLMNSEAAGADGAQNGLKILAEKVREAGGSDAFFKQLNDLKTSNPEQFEEYVQRIAEDPSAIQDIVQEVEQFQEMKLEIPGFEELVEKLDSEQNQELLQNVASVMGMEAGTGGALDKGAILDRIQEIHNADPDFVQNLNSAIDSGALAKATQLMIDHPQLAKDILSKNEQDATSQGEMSPEQIAGGVDIINRFHTADPKFFDNLGTIAGNESYQEFRNLLDEKGFESLKEAYTSAVGFQDGEGLDPAKTTQLVERLAREVEKDPEYFSTITEFIKDKPQMANMFAQQFAENPGAALDMAEKALGAKKMFDGIMDLLNDINPKLGEFFGNIIEKFMGFMGPMLEKFAPSLGKIAGSVAGLREAFGSEETERTGTPLADNKVDPNAGTTPPTPTAQNDPANDPNNPAPAIPGS